MTALVLLASLAVAALTDGSVVPGKTLVVTVFNQTPSGGRIGGAQVCLQGFPLKTTDGQGVVVFDNVRDGSWSLAVWKDGFQRSSRSLLFNDRTSQQTNITVLLMPGAGSGPPCEVAFEARPIVALNPDPPQVTQFFIGGRENPALIANTDNLILFAPHSGPRPSHFRVSTSATFAGAEWRPYAPEIPGLVGVGRFFAGATGSRTLYFQYRSGEQANAPASNVAQDTAEVVSLTEHVLTDAASVIAHAESNGFAFRVTEVASPQDCPTPWGGRWPFRGVLEALYGGERYATGVIAYQAFSGRLLNAPWGLKQIELAATTDTPRTHQLRTDVKVTLHSAGNLRDARATLRFSATPFSVSGGVTPSDPTRLLCPHATASITRITLVGPTGHDWREAFNR